MTQYVRNQINNTLSNQMNKSNTNTITLASAQQAPLLAKSELERKETELIIVDNFNGGKSFSLIETFNISVPKQDKITANSCLISIIEQLSIFGTCDTRVDINAIKLTDSSRDTFYKLCVHDIDLVISTLKNVYLSGRAPKVSHYIYLLALITSITSTDDISEQSVAIIRSKGYKLVPLFRITTHLFEWINTHIQLCSIHHTNVNKQKTIENASGLVLNMNASNKNKNKKESKNILKRSGGTGAGFRNAVKLWYLNKCSTSENAQSLAIQIVKYANRNGFTHKDVLSLVHIKPTTMEKCKCQVKVNCTCDISKDSKHNNIIPLAGQIPLAYAVGGLEQSQKVLIDGINNTNGNDVYNTLSVFAFLCAVEEAKNDSTSIDRVCDLIRIFNLTREMISNTKLNDVSILFRLTVKNRCDNFELIKTQSELLKKRLPLHTLIDEYFPVSNTIDIVNNSEHIGPYRIGMPITALIRNLNNLTSSGLLDVSTFSQAKTLVGSLNLHLTNQDVLHKGFVHPINLFNAWSVYSRGRGVLGSKTWTPDETIKSSLLEAVELAFKGLTGFDMSIAFLMDASGSMSGNGSAPGMPCLTALDIAVLLVLTFYRATSNYAAMYGKSMPNHSIGYFGGPGLYSTNRKIEKMISDSEIAQRSASFKDVSSKFFPTMTFTEAKAALGNGSHLGMTDIGSSFWHLIGKLKSSLENFSANRNDKKTVFELPGYAELMLLVTDNDINSGDQPMDVLNLYWDLVLQGFKLLPFDKDGTKSDPNYLFHKYCPRLVVVATQGTQITVGDPRDTRILNISGFDANAPVLIDTFIRKNEKCVNAVYNGEIDD